MTYGQDRFTPELLQSVAVACFFRTEGTPLHVVVDDVGGSYVTAYGPGLNGGNSGKECEFYVVGIASE